MKYVDNLKRFVTEKQLETFNKKFPKRIAKNNRQDRIEIDYLEMTIINNMKIVDKIEKTTSTGE